MKSGATDPFAEDTDETEESVQQDESTNESSQTDPSDQPDQSENSAQSGSNTSQYDRSDFPRIVSRDTVKEDRDGVHQLFVYEDTEEKEKEARRELEDRLGDVYKLDAREAIYRAGMQNIDDAEEILREWGADI